MLNILVTGAGGYIGSHVTKKLLQDGHKVIAFDNFSCGFREPLELIAKYGSLRVIEGDICNKEDIDRVFKQTKIDLVMHFAALCSVAESMKNPGLYFKNNVYGSLNLFESMRENEVNKIIFSSTCAVYGDATNLPINEQHVTQPKNPYGESKRMIEQLIEFYGKIYGFRYVIFRYFNVSGADVDGEIGDSKKPSQLLIQNAVRGALAVEPFSLTCPKVDTKDGTPVRDYIDIMDLVDAHVRALDYLKKENENVILNLGNGKGWSVQEIIDAVKKELGVEFIVNNGAIRAGEIKEVYADITKARKILGWQPKGSLTDIIQNLKVWYQKKPHGYIK